MQRTFARLVVFASCIAALYACSTTSGVDVGGDDAGADDSSVPKSADGASTVDGDMPSDAAHDTSASDGSKLDGGDASDADTADADAGVDAADAAPPPPTPALRFVGRYDATDPDHPKFGWPGGRIIAHFMGTEVKVTLNETSLYTGPSRWDVILDGARTSTLTPAAGMGTYTIATALANAEHTIELYKRTEGKVGVTQFYGYDFTGGGVLLAPPLTPTHRIEFLGDSVTDGYGDECALATDSFSGATQNERLAYSGLIAHDLDADHHDVSFSGKGVLLNYNRADTVVFDQLFPRTMPETAAADWVFANFTPDVVWMTLGGNDWDQETPATLPPSEAQFTTKYVALVALVRSKYPNAHIFCAIAPSLNDNYPTDMAGVSWNVLTHMRSAMANVVSARAGAGDTKVYAYEFTRAIYPTDLTGCGFHPNLGLHRKMADEAIVAIKAKTGWP